MQRIVEVVGAPDLGWGWRRRRTHFAEFARAICFQQLAGNAARAIHGRFEALYAGAPTAAAVLATPDDVLRAGLSAAKVAAVRDLATKVDGTVSLARIGACRRCRRRRAHAGARDRTVDGGDVPDLPATAPRRVAGRRPRRAHRVRAHPRARHSLRARARARATNSVPTGRSPRYCWRSRPVVGGLVGGLKEPFPPALVHLARARRTAGGRGGRVGRRPSRGRPCARARDGLARRARTVIRRAARGRRPSAPGRAGMRSAPDRRRRTPPRSRPARGSASAARRRRSPAARRARPRARRRHRPGADQATPRSHRGCPTAAARAAARRLRHAQELGAQGLVAGHRPHNTAPTREHPGRVAPCSDPAASMVAC